MRYTIVFRNLLVISGLSFLTALVMLTSQSHGEEPMNSEIKATLNGATLTFDAQTGSITSLSYPGPGTMIEAPPEKAGGPQWGAM